MASALPDTPPKDTMPLASPTTPRPSAQDAAEKPQAAALAPPTSRYTRRRSIHYAVHHIPPEAVPGAGRPLRVLLITGVAASHGSWAPLLAALAARAPAGASPGGSPARPLLVVAPDNFGIGLSPQPTEGKEYRPGIPAMAADMVDILDALAWPSAHVVGFSMGSMVALELAASAPHRVSSLALLAPSARRTLADRTPKAAILPKAVALLRARSKEARARADQRLHFTSSYLKDKHPDGGTNREHWLRAYVAAAREEEEAATAQPPAAMMGQLNMVGKWKLSEAGLAAIAAAAFPVLLVHGKQDLVVRPSASRGLLRRLQEARPPAPAHAPAAAAAPPARRRSWLCCTFPPTTDSDQPGRKNVTLWEVDECAHMIVNSHAVPLAERLSELWGSHSPAPSPSPRPSTDGGDPLRGLEAQPCAPPSDPPPPSDPRSSPPQSTPGPSAAAATRVSCTTGSSTQPTPSPPKANKPEVDTSPISNGDVSIDVAYLNFDVL